LLHADRKEKSNAASIDDDATLQPGFPVLANLGSGSN